MKKGILKESWKGIWEAGAPASRLDLFRCVFALSCLYFYRNIAWSFYSDVPETLWDPPGLAALVLRSSPSLFQMQSISILFTISLIGLAIGFLTRVSAWLAALTAFLLFGSSHSGFYFDHSANAVVLTFFVLACAPALGRQFSVDQFWRKKSQTFQEVDWIWPQRLIQFLFFFTFLAAGLSKLLESGWAWTSEANLKAILQYAGDSFRRQKVFEFQESARLFLLQSDGIRSLVGPTVVLFEIFSFVFFFSKKHLWIGVLIIAALQFGIFMTMYFSFSYFFPMYLIFIPWERVVQRLKIRNL